MFKQDGAIERSLDNQNGQKPENDRQNVTFYKKRLITGVRQGENFEGNKFPEHKNVKGLISKFETEKIVPKSNLVVDMDKKTQAKVASTPLKQQNSTV